MISSIFSMLAGLTTSCDMDLTPAGTIDPDNAILSINDAAQFREGLYVGFRSNAAAQYVYLDEIRSDLFHASIGYGNALGVFYEYTYSAADGDVSAVWSASYGLIANANYFLQETSELDVSEWSAEDVANLNIWRGEAYFLRAFFHFRLAEMFCLPYPGNEQSYGIPYVTSYAPTSDQTRYPDRGTLENTYSMIVSDLDSAAKYITTPGSVGSERISADAVTALQARLALDMADYDLAVEKSSELIDGGRYPLVSSQTAFEDMWFNDSGAECILQLFASYPNELGTSYNYGYIEYDVQKNVYKPIYYPEQWVIDLMRKITTGDGEPSDWRYLTHFYRTDVLVSGGATYNLEIFYKFPGNPSLRPQNSWNYQHKPKIFRIAEMYLIRAEALARGGAPSGTASDPWNDIHVLRGARSTAYQPNQYGENILDAVLNERVRELIGEGFRIQDLERFQRNIVRSAAQVRDAIYFPSTYESFERSYTDSRIIFPIPQAEIDANPNLAGQQNPGY